MDGSDESLQTSQANKVFEDDISDENCNEINARQVSQSQADVCSHKTNPPSYQMESMETMLEKNENSLTKMNTNYMEDTVSGSSVDISESHTGQQNALSQQEINPIKQATESEKRLTSDLGTNDSMSKSPTECVNEDNTTESVTEPQQLTNVCSVSISKNSSERIVTESSSMSELEEDPVINNSQDLLSITSTDSTNSSLPLKTNNSSARDLSEVSSVSSLCDKANDKENFATSQSHTPIILSVRGNVTDIDCLPEPSTTTNLSTDSTGISVSNNGAKNSRHIDHPYNSSVEKKKKRTMPVSLTVTHDKKAPVPPHGSIVKSTLSNTSNDLQVSTFNKQSISYTPSNVALSATNLLLSAVSKAKDTSKGLSPQISTQSFNICGSSLKPTNLVRGVMTSTSNNNSVSCAVNLDNSKTPVTSTVKIIIRGTDNVLIAKKVATFQPKVVTTSNDKHMRNTDETVDVKSLSKQIVDKLFLDYELQEQEGMTRQEVLNTNLLNPCKKQLKYANRRFVCSICGDEFCLEESLKNHFNRKTFILTYYCCECKETITFFNKCNFWLHVRNERPELIDVKMLENETSLFRLKLFFETESLPESKFECKFCLKDFSTKEEKVLHLKRPSPYLYTCDKCSMLLANKCAIKAHLAIHETVGNHHVCPQCGEDIDHSDGLKVLFEHLDSCFHFNTGYVMPCDCGKLFETEAAFKSHFLKSHTKLLCRCPICGNCFTSFDFLAVHCVKSHNVAPSSNKIVLCTICKQGFQNYWKLKGHVENHADKIVGVRKKVLTCFLCQEYFYDSDSLNDHVVKEHTHRPKRCTICFGLFEGRQNLVEHIVSKKCSPHKLPNKLNVCLDKLSNSKPVDDNTYKQMFRLTKSILISKSTASSKESSSKTVTTLANIGLSPTVSFAKPTSGKSSQHAFTPLGANLKTSTKTVATISIPSKAPPRYQSIAPKRAKRTVDGNIVELGSDMEKFQCHTCKICLLGRYYYNKHMMLHKSDHVDEGRTLCCICKKAFSNNVIQSHMESHQKSGTIVCSLCQGRHFKSLAEALQHSENFCYYAIVTNDGAHFVKKKTFQSTNQSANKRAENSDVSKDNESATEMQPTTCATVQKKVVNDRAQIVKKKTSQSTNQSVNERAKNSALLEDNENAPKIQSSTSATVQKEATVFPCLMCGLAFTSKQEKEDHVSRFHDGTRTLFFCLVCKRKGVQKCFTKHNLLSKHISRKHRIVNPGQIAKSIHKEEQNVASGQVVPAELNKQCNGDAPPPKRLRLADEGEFLCGKCGFSSEDSKLFSDHIITHNPKKEPQCPECGLCFTVIAALKKHLFVVHKIKAMDEYLEKRGVLEAEEEEEDCEENEYDSNDSGLVFANSASKSQIEAPRAKRTRTSAKSTPGFECTVCYRSLSSEAALQKHMRNHGMAFIRSKRLDKS